MSFRSLPIKSCNYRALESAIPMTFQVIFKGLVFWSTWYTDRKTLFMQMEKTLYYALHVVSFSTIHISNQRSLQGKKKSSRTHFLNCNGETCTSSQSKINCRFVAVLKNLEKCSLFEAPEKVRAKFSFFNKSMYLL